MPQNNIFKHFRKKKKLTTDNFQRFWGKKKEQKKPPKTSKHVPFLPTHVFAVVASHRKLLVLHLWCISARRAPRQSSLSAKLRHINKELNAVD